MFQQLSKFFLIVNLFYSYKNYLLSFYNNIYYINLCVKLCFCFIVEHKFIKQFKFAQIKMNFIFWFSD